MFAKNRRFFTNILSKNKFCKNNKQAVQQQVKRFKSSQAGEGTESAFGIGAGIGATVGVVLGYVIIPTIQEMFEQKSRFKHSNLKQDDDDDDEQELENETQNLLAHFDRFTDIVESDGRRYMSPQAFLNALFAPKKVTADQLQKNKKLRLLFKFTDSNADGVISFKEFAFLITLLSCNEQQMRIAFKMFDENGNGEIDEEEFKQFINSMHKRHKIDFHPIAKYFFKNKKFITFDEYFGFVSSIKEELLQIEFNLYDGNSSGTISTDAFLELVTNSMNFSKVADMEEFKRNIERVKTMGLLKQNKLDFATFHAFHTMAKHLDDIALSVKLYASQGNALDKTAFKRALTRVAGGADDRTVDVIFALFDTNNDGTLQLDEFVEALKARKIGNNWSIKL